MNKWNALMLFFAFIFLCMFFSILYYHKPEEEVFDLLSFLNHLHFKICAILACMAGGLTRVAFRKNILWQVGVFICLIIILNGYPQVKIPLYLSDFSGVYIALINGAITAALMFGALISYLFSRSIEEGSQ